MQKTSKLLIGLQIAILMTAVALPVQAAINIGAPRPLSGSVVTIKANVPVTTQVTLAPTTTTTPATKTTVTTPTTTNIQTSTPSPSHSIKTSQPNVVSLKNIRNGNKSVAGAMASLMLSPGHRANILDPRFTHVGVGIAYGSAYGNLYVQEFLQQ